MAIIRVKSLCLLAIFVAFAVFSNVVNGAGECGENTAEQEAQKMQSCGPAAQNGDAAVASECCALASKIVDNPACMCAVGLSQTIKSSGGTPENAFSIPKRCGIANRHAGYKCGDYEIP